MKRKLCEWKENWYWYERNNYARPENQYCLAEMQLINLSKCIIEEKEIKRRSLCETQPHDWTISRIECFGLVHVYKYCNNCEKRIRIAVE